MFSFKTHQSQFWICNVVIMGPRILIVHSSVGKRDLNTLSQECDYEVSFIRGGADKSLARPNSWCRRMELIVSLERGVCSYTKLQVFSCYRGLKETCQAMRAISTTWRCKLSSSFFPARQGTEGNSRHSDRNIRGTCTIICHQKLGGPV